MRATGGSSSHAPRRTTGSAEFKTGALADFDSVWMRKDPPFDMKFFFTTHVLSLIDESQCFLLNHPRGLREANEKLYALRFPEQIPQTLVASDMRTLKAFMAELGGEMIVKPLDGCGGSGVFYLRAEDRNTNSILEAATDNGRRLMMAQRYLPEIRQGDKRIIVLDGEPLGAVLRVPLESETRGNIHVGGQVVKTDVTKPRSGNLRGLGAVAEGRWAVPRRSGRDRQLSHRSERHQPDRDSRNQPTRRRALGEPSGRFCRAAGRKARRCLSQS